MDKKLCSRGRKGKVNAEEDRVVRFKDVGPLDVVCPRKLGGVVG